MVSILPVPHILDYLPYSAREISVKCKCNHVISFLKSLWLFAKYKSFWSFAKYKSFWLFAKYKSSKSSFKLLPTFLAHLKHSTDNMLCSSMLFLIPRTLQILFFYVKNYYSSFKEVQIFLFWKDIPGILSFPVYTDSYLIHLLLMCLCLPSSPATWSCPDTPHGRHKVHSCYIQKGFVLPSPFKLKH